ncbi:MAG TPA: hypothetical protein VGI12_14375 [Vicinamibacterales bacterium]
MGLRIGIDVDGVLADFRTAFHEAAVRWLRHDIDDTQDLEIVSPLSAGDVRRVWDRIATAPNWWMEVLAYEPDQIARLYSLTRAAGWEVFFLTKRPPSAGDSVQFQTQWWIERFGFYLPAVLTVPGSRGDIANGLRLDLVLDDQLLNCVEVISTTTTKAVLVLRSNDPASRQQAADRGIGVVSTLSEAITVIERLHDVLPQQRGRLMRLVEWFSPVAEMKSLPANPRAIRPIPPYDP